MNFHSCPVAFTNLACKSITMMRRASRTWTRGTREGPCAPVVGAQAPRGLPPACPWHSEALPGHHPHSACMRAVYLLFAFRETLPRTSCEPGGGMGTAPEHGRCPPALHPAPCSSAQAPQGRGRALPLWPPSLAHWQNTHTHPLSSLLCILLGNLDIRTLARPCQKARGV